jgi:hypothetical protein
MTEESKSVRKKATGTPQARTESFEMDRDKKIALGMIIQYHRTSFHKIISFDNIADSQKFTSTDLRNFTQRLSPQNLRAIYTFFSAIYNSDAGYEAAPVHLKGAIETAFGYQPREPVTSGNIQRILQSLASGNKGRVEKFHKTMPGL